jgi:hypothetical protein
LAAWWSGDAADLLASEPEAIVQRLAMRLVETHFINRDTQLHAWRQQIVVLRTALEGCPKTWRILFEYPLLRLGRRIDVVLLTRHVIIVLEFKVGATSISVLDRQQTEDYALDLFDFHAGSRAHPVVPILVATEAQAPPPEWPLLWHGVTPVFAASTATLSHTSLRLCRHSTRVPGKRHHIVRCPRSWRRRPCCTTGMESPKSPRRVPMSAILVGPPMRSAAPLKQHVPSCDIRYCSSPAYPAPARRCAA